MNAVPDEKKSNKFKESFRKERMRKKSKKCEKEFGEIY